MTKSGYQGAMGVKQEFLAGLKRAEQKYGNAKKLADYLGVAPNLITRWLNEERDPKLSTMAPILDKLGARIAFLDEEKSDTARNVCFVDAKVVNAMDGIRVAEEDYIAVPLAEEPVAAGPGLLPQDLIRGWVMVWKHHDSVRFTRDLVAVEIGKNEHSMLPTFRPGDILLIDRSNQNPEHPGKSWLVCDPDGGCAIKRVSTRPKDGDTELIFYSDNTQEFPPTSYHLNQDFDGDITRAIAGRVVWAWSDVRDK